MRNSTRRKLKRTRFLRKQQLNRFKFLTSKPKVKKHITRVYSYSYSETLKYLMAKKFFERSGNNNGEAVIDIPRVFSFTKNPDETIDILRRLLYYGTYGEVKSIRFNHSNCEELGIGASTVMDVILMEIKKTSNIIKRGISLGGLLPKDKKIRDILEVSGILKHLGFDLPEKDGIRKLELIKGKNGVYLSGSAATKITEYYVNCLLTQKLSLSKKGQSKIGHMIGEVIDNCELHGGSNLNWYSLGHYHLYDDEEYGECHLVIFNFGNTIYESLKLESTSKEIIQSLNDLTKNHRGFFKFNWTEESLWTLYALQEGVSRLKTEKEPDRGTGTIKLIDSFQTIGQASDGKFPEMSITSGRTHIYFDDKYKLQSQRRGLETRKIIAFNKENDLSKPPDVGNVKILKNFFPGTVISMKFYLDREYIKNAMEGNAK